MNYRLCYYGINISVNTTIKCDKAKYFTNLEDNINTYR